MKIIRKSNVLTNIPVKHSTNLKPSAFAMASSILELTVDVTIANFSIGWAPDDL